MTTCEHVDYHADMYPEFAPEPIEVPCTELATATLIWDEHDQDGWSRMQEAVCETHADRFDPEVGYLPPWIRNVRVVQGVLIPLDEV